MSFSVLALFVFLGGAFILLSRFVLYKLFHNAEVFNGTTEQKAKTKKSF